MKLHRLAVLAAVLACTACAAAAPSPSSDAPRTRRDLITYEQLMRTEESTLYEAIMRLQPGWLQRVSRHNDSDIGVFVNGARVGSVEFLQQLPASQVQEVRYLNSRQIEAELTSLQSRGLGSAIMITSRRM
jgi:hypothetical protein